MNPRQYSLVKFDIGDLDESWWEKYPFERDGIYVFLGEIPNMPDHCVVADYKTGKLIAGFHTEGFTEIPDDET